MHKVFISFHHKNDQAYKDELIRLNSHSPIFIDASVDTGDISDDLDDQAIREKIRDEYLKESSVTILLVGTETRKRKHIDWELYSSMYDGKVNKKSGLIVINLPSSGCPYFTVAHGEAEKQLYPATTSWADINSRIDYERRYPLLPDRIIDNLVTNKKSRISVTPWSTISSNWGALEFLINSAFETRAIAEYDLFRAMRRSDS